MAAGPNVEALLKKLDELNKAHTQTLQEVYEALSHLPANNALPAPSVASASTATAEKKRRRSTLDPEFDVGRPKVVDGKPVTYHSSLLSGESDESDDDDEEYYVQKPLPTLRFDHEDLKAHLKTYKFKEDGKKLLKSVVENGKLHNPGLFPNYDPDELWHESHYSVFDVGPDGAPINRSEVVKEGTTKIDSAIWQCVQVCIERHF